MNLADFTTLIEGCDGCQLSGEKIEKVYNFFEAGSGFNQDTLFLASRSYYSVAAESVLTKEQSIEEGSETLRRLELKELLEVLEGRICLPQYCSSWSTAIIVVAAVMGFMITCLVLTKQGDSFTMLINHISWPSLFGVYSIVPF